jgi:hypothetical protein
LGLIAVGTNVTAEGHNALIAILTYRNIFEIGLIQRFPDAVSNVG